MKLNLKRRRKNIQWFNYNGELYTTEGLYVEPNLVGTLVLRQKRITHKYDWFLLGYYKDVEVLKKVKPKTEDGRKFFYYGHAEDDETGDVLILCGIKERIGKDMEPYGQNKNFVVLRYNQDVELVGETEFSFEYPMNVAFSRVIPAANDGVDGLSLVFAPMGGMGMNKYADPDKNDYKYVRVNSEPSIVDNLSFQSYASYWQIDELVHDRSTDAVYLYGPSAAGKDKYYNLINREIQI